MKVQYNEMPTSSKHPAPTKENDDVFVLSTLHVIFAKQREKAAKQTKLYGDVYYVEMNNFNSTKENSGDHISFFFFLNTLHFNCIKHLRCAISWELITSNFTGLFVVEKEEH